MITTIQEMYNIMPAAKRLTLYEAADLAGVSYKTLAKAALNGTLRTSRDGYEYKVTEYEVRTWLQKYNILPKKRYPKPPAEAAAPGMADSPIGENESERLTLAEAEEALGISRRQLGYAIVEGHLLRGGERGSYYITRVEIERFKKERGGS